MASTERSDTLPTNLHTRFLCAFVEVPVSLLDFKARCNYPREVDDHIKARLSELFSHGFEPGVPNNHIAGVVTEAELGSILHELQVTKEQLRRTIYSGKYPLVESTRIWCPADRHRVEAAAELFGDQVTWVVQLHCPPGDTPIRLYEEFIRALSERYFPQCGHSDGEIFRSIRRYQDTQPELVGDWLVRLSPSKRISLNLLLDEASGRKKTRAGARHRGVLEMLDRILMFPGLWEGLELGNLHKHLALRCNDEIARYLEHVGATWDLITGGDPEIQSCVDINTARGLQALAPARSWADRKAIDLLLANKQVFGGVRDPHKRVTIQERLLRVDGLIPTIKSFHENMKLFSITAKILRTYLLPERSRASLSKYLEEIWSPPRVAFVEFAEGSFQAVSAPPSFQLAYVQLFCAALRNFPRLSDDGPKIDSGDRIRSYITDSAVSQFYRRVALLGFWNDAIRDSVRRSGRRSESGDPAVLEGQIDTEVMSTDRRWGRPYTRIFRRMRQVAFLPQLHCSVRLSAFPTVEHIVRDFLRSFLGTLGPDLQPIAGEIISIAAQNNRALSPITEEDTDDESSFRDDDMVEVMSSRDASLPDVHSPSEARGDPSPEVIMADGSASPAADSATSRSSMEGQAAQATQDIEMQDSIGQCEDLVVADNTARAFRVEERLQSQVTLQTTPHVTSSSKLPSGSSSYHVSEGPTPSISSFALAPSMPSLPTMQSSIHSPQTLAPSLRTMSSSIYSLQTMAPSLPTVPSTISSPRNPAPSLPTMLSSVHSQWTPVPSLPSSIYSPKAVAPSLPSVPSSIYSLQTGVPSFPVVYPSSMYSPQSLPPLATKVDSATSGGASYLRSTAPSFPPSNLGHSLASIPDTSPNGVSSPQSFTLTGSLSNISPRPNSISGVDVNAVTSKKHMDPAGSARPGSTSTQVSNFSQRPDLDNISSPGSLISRVPSYVQSNSTTLRSPPSEAPSIRMSSFSQWPDLENMSSPGSMISRVPSYVQSSSISPYYESSQQEERPVAPSPCPSVGSPGDSMVSVQLSSPSKDWSSTGSRSVLESPQRISQLNGFLDHGYWDI